MMYHTGIPPGNASTTPVVRRLAFSDVVADGVVNHAGFCVPLGARLAQQAGQAAWAGRARRPGQEMPALLAVFQGLPESPLEGVLLSDVRLSGVRTGGGGSSGGGTVLCANASVTSSGVIIDGRPRRVDCG